MTNWKRGREPDLRDQERAAEVGRGLWCDDRVRILELCAEGVTISAPALPNCRFPVIQHSENPIPVRCPSREINHSDSVLQRGGQSARNAAGFASHAGGF